MPEDPTGPTDGEAPEEQLPEIQEDSNSTGLVPKIKEEIEELRGVVQAFGIERFKDGTWFNEFLRTVLKPYGEKILKNGGVAYFRKKYPGFTRDMLAQKLCDTATQYASIAGGASGLASSAAFAATIGTAGGASVVTVPAGVAAVLAETLFTVRLQLRLVFDLYILQDYPLDLDDPEDMYKAFCITYGIQFATDTAGGAAKTFSPEVARSLLRGMIHGNTKLIQEMAAKVLGPRIGKKITEKALLRTAVPIVGVGISAGWNYLTTKQIGETVRQELRCLGRVRDAAGRLSPQLVADPEATAALLEALIAIITADGRFDLREQELYCHIKSFLQVPPETIEVLEKHTDLDPPSISERLSRLDGPELKMAIRQLLEYAAAADGTLQDAEREVLQLFEEALGFEFDQTAVCLRAADFRKADTQTAKVVQAAGKLASDAGQIVAGAGKRFGSWAAGWLPKQQAEPASESVSTPAPQAEATKGSAEDPLALLEKLARLRDAGVLTEEEFSAKKTEVLGRL